MDANQFRDTVRRVASTLSFAWLQMKPELQQTYHQLALDSRPKLRGIRAPFDSPVHDLVLGVKTKPSEMQTHLLNTTVPVSLIAIQSIAEEALRGKSGNSDSVYNQIENLAQSSKLSRSVASEAHHWRMVRNVIVHGSSVVDQHVVKEAKELASKQLVHFSEFRIWGPLLDAGHGGTLVPVTEFAATNPESSPSVIEITVGQRVDLGVGDLLAAGEVWASLISVAV